MAGSQARAVVAVEVLEEQDVILPLGIGLELLRTSVHWPTAGFIPQEDPLQTIGYFPGYLEQVHQLARAGGTPDLEIVSVIQIELKQRTNEQRIHRHPDWPAPVGVAAEHAGVGFSRKVIHAVFLTLDVYHVGMLVVIFGERPDPIGTEELVLIQHACQNPPQPILIHKCNYAALTISEMTGPGYM